ncbi:ALYREF mRNA export adapter [Abortiporus biennis]
MDKTLDEIISTRPKGIRRTSSRRGGKSQVLGNRGAAPATRARAAPASNGAKSAPAPAQPADKIIVSNLPPDVNEAQVKELFSQTGLASVQFQRKGDGTKAYAQYNNRLIDGKRPMKIEIVVDPSRPAAPASLASRVAPAPAAAAPAAQPRTGGRPRRGRGGGGPRRKNERPQKSAADLDAEMEDYTASSAAPAAPAAA